MPTVREEKTELEDWVPFRPGLLEVAGGKGHLLASRCPACGARYFPRRQVCARCFGDKLEPVPLSTRGTLYTFTVVRQSTPAFQVPYVLGYVDLPEGVRVLGQIAGCAPEEVRIGMPLALRVERVGQDQEGRPILGYLFRPEEGEEKGHD